MLRRIFYLFWITYLNCNLFAVNATITNDKQSSQSLQFPSTTSSLVITDNNASELLWLPDALRDIAYYLRGHKFNEYDRRYETEPEKAPRVNYMEFPRPPLRSLHWEVHKNCEPSFIDCVDYLRKKVRNTGLKRSDDPSVIIEDQKWTLAMNLQQINQTDWECYRIKLADAERADPFEGPIERFQWRVTASYFLCWYTMQSTRELAHLHETSCDNFANCLDPAFGPHNHDRRADDALSFNCALYSFCPDPCCPMKHLSNPENCWNSDDNPCFGVNPAGQRECVLNRTLNTDFSDMILNRWNVTCGCPSPGFEWNSMYGICVDIDECTGVVHNCDLETQACINLPGTYKCACKWGYSWNSSSKKCLTSPVLENILLNKRETESDEVDDHKAKSIVKRLWMDIFHKSGSPPRQIWSANCIIDFQRIIVTSIILMVKLFKPSCFHHI